VLVFIIAGFVIGGLLRFIVTEIIGPEVRPFDRILGAVLDIARVVFIAVLIVIIFDRITRPAAGQASLSARNCGRCWHGYQL
jgi:uncharacterized membrane protein required for colicin V production